MNKINKKPKNLFQEFPKASKGEWKDKIVKDLRGGDYKKLIWKTEEGFDVQPFYTQEDLKELKYLMKSHNSSYDDAIGYLGAKQWQNQQLIIVENEKEANQKALLALNNGCEALTFDLCKITLRKVIFEQLLKDIFIENCTISYQIDANTTQFINELKQYLSSIGNDFSKINGSLIINGEVNNNIYSNLIHITDNILGFKVISVLHHDNTINISAKIGSLLSNSVKIIKSILEKNVPLKSIFNNIELHYKTSDNYFFEIAAIRVIRMLFTEIIHQFGHKEYVHSEVKIHVDTYFELTEEIIKNPYLNMLGNTTQAMSAIIGGCNSLTVLPYNKNIEKTDAFSERISRNVSNILKEESYLNKVNDPSAGSYYIETLTDQIAKKAWEYLREHV